MKRIDTYNGFTLIETLLYVSITSVLILSISILLATTLNSKAENRAKIEVQQQAKFISDHIESNIKKSTEIIEPIVGSSQSTLTLINDNSTDQYEYSLSIGTLYFQLNSDSPEILSNDKVFIESLTFTNNSGIITYEFVVSYINGDGVGSIDYSSTHKGSAGTRK
jgi:type II secretory pathway pseudopilin PulG